MDPSPYFDFLKTNQLMHDLKGHFHEPESWTKVTLGYGKHMSWLPPITQFTLNLTSTIVQLQKNHSCWSQVL